MTQRKDKVRKLRQIGNLKVPVRPPFSFRYTMWKPSHFLTGLEQHSPEITWRTMRLGEEQLGLRLEMVGDVLSVLVFGTRSLRPAQENMLRSRIVSAYGLDEDLRTFLAMLRTSLRMPQSAKRLRGMRMSCPESFFEIAVISLLLQNTTIKRSEQMMGCLLARYGGRVSFDGVELASFFTPKELAFVPELEFREGCRLGYRAAYLPAFAAFFERADDRELSRMSRDHFMATLEEIRGVGPYTSNIIASHARRDPGALALDVWNRKLVAKRLLGVEDATEADAKAALERDFPGCEALALMYLVESEYVERPLVELVQARGR